MKTIRLFSIGTVALSLLLGHFQLGFAQVGMLPAVRSIDERLAELEQEVRILKRQREVELEIQKKKASETPAVAAGKDGFAIKSADGNFVLKFRGQIQTDSRFFTDNNGSTGLNTFLIRRARPTLEGSVFKYVDFRLMPDFGGGQTSVNIQDAWLDFKYWKAVQIRAGKFKSPIGLERLQSDPAGQFIETALSTNLVPNRDIGIDIHGEFFDGALTYDAGVCNGVADAGSADTDVRDDKEFAGRIFALPFKNSSSAYLNGLGIGMGGSAGTAQGATLPTYRSGGQQTIFGFTPSSGTVTLDGRRLRLAPQAYYYYGPFGILSEFVLSSQEASKANITKEVNNKAWQIASTYVLTGENASYAGVVPRYAFDPKNGKWGAFELAGRFSSLMIDQDAFPVYANPATSVEDARAWTLGLNWYLNKNLKWMTHFEESFYDGGAANGGDRKTEHALFSRIQIYV